MSEVRLGLRENLPQFTLLVLLNAFVDFVLADLPPQPAVFAENRRRNLAGE